MPIPRIDDIPETPRRTGRGSKWWAEWCFVKVCFHHFRFRLLLMAILLFSGGLLFKTLEPEKNHSLSRATYYTFSLIFGEPPEEFPQSRVLQAMFFIVPILGLTVIIEGIIDFALIVRDRRRFEKSWCVMHANSFKNHVVLVGLGRLGFKTFQLLRRIGEPVVVIERDPTNQFLEDVRRDGSPLLIGDARREALLQDANIAAARSIILASDDDMANLEAALDARKLHTDIRVVLRMFDQNMADKFSEGFDISMAMSQSAISAPTFATCALAPATFNSFIVGGRLVAMQRWLVRKDGPLCGKTIADVLREFHIGVVEYQDASKSADAEPALCPVAETTLKPGDGLILQGALQELETLRSRALQDAVGQRSSA